MLFKYLLPAFILFISCVSSAKKQEISSAIEEKPAEAVVISLHEQLMDSTLCDGFDFPLGDKNGTGWTGFHDAGEPGETRSLTNQKAQGLYSIGDGKVVFAGEVKNGEQAIIVEHRFAENGQVKTIYVQYLQMDELLVKQNDHVLRRQKIGMINEDGLLYIEIRKSDLKNSPAGLLENTDAGYVQEHYEKVTGFIRSHRKLMVPFKKDKLVLVDKGHFKCYLYNKGNLVRTYEIALGQVPVGAKEKQGDLKVPEGEYRICERTKGPFTHNWSAAYLGTRWMCLTYPNTFDAQKALDKKTITREQYNKIATATKAGTKPPQNTALGGGIGLHGWIDEDWSNESDRAQTWGCVSFHNNDLNDFYELVNIGTTVIIVP